MHVMKLSRLLVAWLVISVIVSIPLDFLDWGNPEGFHGSGFPFSTVFWERDRVTGGMVDFPNPLAFLLNPLVIFIAGAILIFLGCRMRRFSRRSNP